METKVGGRGTLVSLLCASEAQPGALSSTRLVFLTGEAHHGQGDV